MQMQQLVAYCQQLQLENAELKKHIFNIQQQLNQKNEQIELLATKKQELSEHIAKCENEIIRREEREVGLLDRLESLGRELEIYAEEIARVKAEQPKDEAEARKDSSRATKLPPKATQSVTKCRGCQTLVQEKDGLFVELQREQEKNYMLARDVDCLIGTLCAQ